MHFEPKKVPKKLGKRLKLAESGETDSGSQEEEKHSSIERILTYRNNSLKIKVFEEREPKHYFNDFMALMHRFLEEDDKSEYSIRVREDRFNNKSYFSLKHKEGLIEEDRTREYDFQVENNKAPEFLENAGLIYTPKKDKIKIQEKYTFMDGEYQNSIELNNVKIKKHSGYSILGFFLEIETRSTTSRNYPSMDKILDIAEKIGMEKPYRLVGEGGNRELRGYKSFIKIAKNLE